MSCLNNFSIGVQLNKAYTLPAELKTWGTLGNYHWTVFDPSISTKQIRGFKNINIYKIKFVGQVLPSLTTQTGIITDYGIRVNINGQISIIGGDITPNAFSAVQTPSSFFLSKYISEVEIPEGITSPTSVTISDFVAMGQNGEAAANMNLRLLFQVVCYYKFEGE